MDNLDNDNVGPPVTATDPNMADTLPDLITYSVSGTDANSFRVRKQRPDRGGSGHEPELRDEAHLRCDSHSDGLVRSQCFHSGDHQCHRPERRPGSYRTVRGWNILRTGLAPQRSSVRRILRARGLLPGHCRPMAMPKLSLIDDGALRFRKSPDYEDPADCRRRTTHTP